MKTVRMLVICVSAFLVNAVNAATFDFPTATGDISIVGQGGWNAMPGVTDLVRFSRVDTASYIASADVEFASLYISASAVFNLHENGDHTVKLANFAVAVNDKMGTLNGGVWDISGAVSGTANNEVGAFGTCNIYNTSGTTLIMAKGCVVTNVNRLIVSNGGAGNRISITDGSKVYTKNAYLDYRTANDVGKNGVLEVLSDAELTASERFEVGSHFGATGNTARFDTGAKFSLRQVKVGKEGACDNTLQISGNSTTGEFVTATYIGSENVNNPSSGNKLILNDGASLTCSIIYLSPTAGSVSNGIYIAGADTSFTATVTNVARYPFVYRGSHNTFEMDGATWNYWNTMQLDDAASSNTIRFVNGARLNVESGIVSGTNHVASCGNRVYVGNGSELNLLFLYISRCDNVVTVSNSTISATRTTDSWSGIRFGAKLANVDESNIGGNGLVIQGNSPSVSAVREATFEHGSFLRFEAPEGSYADGCIPLAARAFSMSDDSSLQVECAFGRMSPRKYTLISTTAGITIPEGVLAAANDSLSAQGNTAARLLLADGGKTLLLAVSKGTVVSIR